jgi:CRP/FNR family cyclic AMP-dependent transcriptional regulator
LLDGKERTADATAIAPCSLAVLERRDVLSFLDRHPSAWLGIVEVLCTRLRNTDQHIAEIALLGLPARLAKAILRLLGPQSPQPGMQIKSSQRALGNMVGASRESINKCLGEWQRQGIVRIDGTVISVTDDKALQRLADDG